MNPKLFEDARLSLPVIGTGGTQVAHVSNLRNFALGEANQTIGTVTTPDGLCVFAIVSWGYSDSPPYAYSPLAVFAFYGEPSPRVYLEKRIQRCLDHMRITSLENLQYWYDSILVYQQVIRYGEQLGVL